MLNTMTQEFGIPKSEIAAPLVNNHFMTFLVCHFRLFLHDSKTKNSETQ